MPGRLSTRNSTSSRVTRKSSVPTLNSRRSTASRASAAEAAPDEGPTTALRTNICIVFTDAQKTTAGHRKLIVNLRKIHEACCYEPSKPSKTGFDGFEEDDFNIEVARCVLRVLCVKKAEGAGDRIIRFLGQFLKHASEKDMALVPQEELEEAHVFPETPSSRLTSHILSILLPILTSKEKTVRYRATQIVSHIINSLDSIDDEYYHLLRAGLLKRVKDREPMVRVQAVLGLGRLAGNEGGEEAEGNNSDDDDANSLLGELLDVLQNDPSADVRRSLLLNLPLTPATLPYLLERARDLDAATRRALYSRLLPALGDFRHLSLSMREKLLRWGLRDRDENVRKAAARLFREIWIEHCAGTQNPQSGEQAEIAPPNVDALLELLERIDIVNAGVEDGIAQEAMKEFWAGRPDYREAVTFEDSFWDNLTSEKAFLARSFNDFCRQQNDSKFETMVEEKMPEVTKLAFFLQNYTNVLIKQLQSMALKPEEDGEEGLVELEFVVEQLLHIALTLDYTDEIGRRKMFALLREILALPELPEEITKLAIEVLRSICGTDSAAEREFCGIVLEAVAEVHDTITPDMPSMVEDTDESFHSAKSEVTETAPTEAKNKKLLADSEEQDEEKAIKEIIVNLKCLHIAQCMLQNVGENLQENVHLVTMLNNLVVPAVRSHEAPIRERGLHCLGLCCLLDKTLADENLVLFLHCFNKGHSALQTTALQILSDILMTHPSLLATPTNPEASLQKQVFKVFSKGVKAAHEPEVQSTATTALCKLMLTRVITDADLLRQLVITFFDPATRDNAATRQALSYFLPMFAHSRQENMSLLAEVVPAIVHSVVGMGEELEEDEEMVGMSAFGGILVDWTDPRKLVVLDTATASWDEAGKKENKAVSADIHLDLAAGLLEKAMGHGCQKEERKVLLTMVGKLYVSPTSAPEKLADAFQIATEAIDVKIASDAPSRNALTKFHSALAKAVGDKSMSSPRKSMAPASTTDASLENIEEGNELAESGETDKMEGLEKAVQAVVLEDPFLAEPEDSVLNELLEDEEEL